jgi:hypothetical protein
MALYQNKVICLFHPDIKLMSEIASRPPVYIASKPPRGNICKHRAETAKSFIIKPADTDNLFPDGFNVVKPRQFTASLSPILWRLPAQ